MKTAQEWLTEIDKTPGLHFTIAYSQKDAFLACIERIQKDAYIQGGLDAITKAQEIHREAFAKFVNQDPSILGSSANAV